MKKIGTLIMVLLLVFLASASFALGPQDSVLVRPNKGAVITLNSSSKSFILTNLKGRYWKFVPTLTGATTWTIKATPCP